MRAIVKSGVFASFQEYVPSAGGVKRLEGEEKPQGKGKAVPGEGGETFLEEEAEEKAGGD